jgi:Spy/CpxP family protein refolding chaperone
MRKSRVIGLVVASLVSAASLAQAQTSAPSARQERHDNGRGMEGRQGRGGLLRGITLTDAEKAHVKQIHEKYNAEAKTLRESLRPAMQDARAARQKGDSAGVKAAWDKTAGDREKLRALMDRERAEIRTALTPEHQQTFDANAKQVEQRRAEFGKNGKGDRAGRAGLGKRRGTRAS